MSNVIKSIEYFDGEGEVEGFLTLELDVGANIYVKR